jgi:hypothetical protein
MMAVPMGRPRRPPREIKEYAVPPSFDWRTENIVTPVWSQGSCGSCYIFMATGAIEGAYRIATGQLSNQMLLTAFPLALALFVVVGCNTHHRGTFLSFCS